MTGNTQSSNSTATLVGLLLIMASFAFMALFQVPALREVRAKQAEKQAVLEAKQSEVAALSAAESQIQAKESQLRNAGVDPDMLGQIIPVSENVPSLYVQMESLIGAANGVSNVTYQIGKPANDPVDGAVKIPVVVSGTGSYTNLKSFVHTLETSTRPATFSVVSFSQAADGSLSLSATGFYRSQTISTK